MLDSTHTTQTDTGELRIIMEKPLNLFWMYRYLSEHEFDDKTGMIILPPGTDPEEHFKEAVERYANE